ncbi:FAD-dependent monooxygenase [Mucilaginibacter gynuensis]|uniref:FAD-dependent monooxygenase n=1 Tax=Mucilaginibacter gynuensis TaxID=1302236 RepID=A0ABP8H4X7_9SPHI
MVISEQHVQVLIVGAGPSGLMMAAQLLRHGVQPAIIDTRQGPTDYSKALAVQARTLEIYRQMGIAERIVKEGKHASGVTFNSNGKPQASLSFNDIGTGKTAFPYVHFYQQSKNERLLLDYLTLNCCPVYWETSLISLQQDTDKITTQLKNTDSEYTITCDRLIGADGAHSTVRKQLNIPFRGDTYQHKFYLADVKLANELGDNIQLYPAKDGFAAFFPMPEENCFRIVGSLPYNLTESEENLQLDDVLPHLSKIAGYPVKVVHCNWFTLYKLHHRMAEHFRQQRCFLVGDAAHIHSPVGGQGMNTGLQDAYNLGWKLAGVVSGQISPAILDSYETERMPVAKDLLNSTDRAFSIIMSKNWLAGLFKSWVLPKLLNFMWSSQKLKAAFFEQVSQTGISYRQSRLNLHLSNSSPVKAGDRLPYVKIFDEKKQEETDLHEWCSKPGFTLIVLGKLQELDLFTLAKWITQNYNGNLNFFYLPPSLKNQEVFDHFKIGEKQKKAFIIRPDMYIGYINDVVDIDMMDNYLLNVVSFVKRVAT